MLFFAFVWIWTSVIEAENPESPEFKILSWESESNIVEHLKSDSRQNFLDLQAHLPWNVTLDIMVK